jgi:hypothetical protein
VLSEEDVLEITIYNKEWLRDKVLAQGLLSVSDLLVVTEEESWYALRDRGQIQGEILL